MLVRYYANAPWFAGGSTRKAQRQVEACRERDAGYGHEASALFAMAKQDYADAVSGFAAARALRPNERDTAFYLARAFIGAKQNAKALQLLEELVAEYPRFYDAWLELGLLAAQSGSKSARGTAALAHYVNEAQSESPAKRAQAAEALAGLHVASDRPNAAVEALKAAIATGAASTEAEQRLTKLCRGEPRPASCNHSR